jgi:hypothetical protein
MLIDRPPTPFNEHDPAHHIRAALAALNDPHDPEHYGTATHLHRALLILENKTAQKEHPS